MGRLGEEVSQKIKSAIRAKLIELGVNMENELPDYIMVLVANKKTQKQMEEDLQLFLGSSTLLFTTWLHSVLKKLEQVTVSKGLKKKSEETKEKSRNSSSGEQEEDSMNDKKENTMQESPSTEIDIKEETENSKLGFEPMSEDDNDEKDCIHISSGTEEGPPPSPQGRSILLDSDVLKRSKFKGSDERSSSSDQNRISESTKGEILKEPVQKDRTRSPDGSDNEGRSNSMERKKHKSVDSDVYDKTRSGKNVRGKIKDAREIIEQKVAWSKKDDVNKRKNHSSIERERKKRQLPSVSKLVIRESEKEVEVTVPSLVKVTPRPKPSGIQANCNLILKAVADAEKSVATTKTTSYTKREKRKGSSKVTREELNDYVPPSKISVFLPNRVPSSKDIEDENKVQSLASYETEDNVEPMEISQEDYYPDLNWCKNGSTEVQQSQPSSTKEKEVDPKFVVTFNNVRDGLTDTYLDDMWEEECIDLGVEMDEDLLSREEIKGDETNETFQRVLSQKVPFNRNRLGPAVAPVVAVRPLQQKNGILSGISSEGQGTEETDEEPKQVIHLKILKRCKYWPNCAVGTSCSFHHPEIMCRMFPNCKYGNQCIYVHPPCKYGNQCLNPLCSYMHVWAPNNQALAKTISKSTSATSSSTVVPSKQPCMFYPKCTNKLCRYQHPVKLQICKFGDKCLNLSCQFGHNNLPTRDQLRWTKT